MIYIFVEGDRDENFINKVLGNLIDSIFGYYKVVTYSNMKKKKIKEYIQTIKCMNGSEYLFIGDQDGNKGKKDKLLEEYPFLDSDRLFISIYEIESWIAAGISDKLMKKYKIKSFNNTEAITKEKFNSIKPSELYTNEFIAYILEEYDILKAIERNSSFNTFYQFLDKKKQAKGCF